MKKSDTITKLAAALVRAQSQIQPAIKDSKNPFYNSTYANLESCWEALRKPLTLNGLSVLQLPCDLGSKPALETVLLHESGEWISETTPLLLVKQDPQALGSSLTYQRRYSLAAITSLVQSDDDGNVASGKNVPQPQIVSPPKTDYKREPNKLATESQKKFIWAKVKNDLGLDDETARAFIHNVSKKQSSKELLAGDVDLILDAIARAQRPQPTTDFPIDDWNPSLEPTEGDRG